MKQLCNRIIMFTGGGWWTRWTRLHFFLDKIKVFYLFFKIYILLRIILSCVNRYSIFKRISFLFVQFSNLFLNSINSLMSLRTSVNDQFGDREFLNFEISNREIEKITFFIINKYSISNIYLNLDQKQIRVFNSNFNYLSWNFQFRCLTNTWCSKSNFFIQTY